MINLRNSYFFFFIIFIYFFSLNYFQSYHQHWTSLADQDPVIIYNSLLIASGFDQEYRDHPAYSTFLVLGGVYKFLSLFFDNFNLEQVFKSENIDKNFQNLFYIARFLNTFYLFLSSYLIFRILQELNIKKIISVISVLIFTFFLASYEVLYLLRSEILSILLFLFSIYYFLKAINSSKAFYIILTGVFFCFSMLAKIQIIFLYFILVISIPFIINYLKLEKNTSINLINKNYNFKLSLFIVSLFIIFFFSYHIFIGVIYFKQTKSLLFSLNNNLDFYFFSLFIIFYCSLIAILSKKKLADVNLIVFSISLILVGFILAVGLILILDLLNIIPVHPSIFLRIMSPIEFMNMHTIKSNIELVNIWTSIKELFLIGLYDLGYDFNSFYDPKILAIKNRVFFRLLYIILLLIMFLSFLKKVKNENINHLVIVFFLGVIIYFSILTIRETHGYNLYLIPLYLFIFSILLNNLNKNYLLVFSLLFSFIVIFENYSFKTIHKNAFVREPRIHHICHIKNWRNSSNYFYDNLFSLHVPFVGGNALGDWFGKYLDQFYGNDKVLLKYCEQLNKYTNDEIKFYFPKK